MPTSHITIPRFDDIEVDKLLKEPESEAFERTGGGQDNIGKAIAGFGTKDGGLLLVGQKDRKEGGGIVGIQEEDFQREFTQAIASVKPAPLTQQKFVPLKEGKIALIRIQDVGTLRPCSYKGTYYERKGDSTRQLEPEEVRRYHLRFGSPNPEDTPTHAKKEDVDGDELSEYSMLLQRSKDNVLQSVTSEKGFLTVRGVIVLSKRPENFVEGAFVEIQRYENIAGSPPVPLGSPIKISKPARKIIEEITAIIQQNLPVTQTYDGAKMVAMPTIPVSVIRESITNAVAHRNYRSHEHIRVRIFADGFDVNNPAAIDGKMWLDIQASRATYHPNEGLYTFLNPAQLYEGRGEGIWKMKEELERLGKKTPEFKVIGETPSTFYAKISLSPAKAKDVRFQKLEELIARKNELTTTDVMKHLQVSRVTAIGLLKKLVEQNRLEHRGATRASKYLVRKSHPP